MSSPLSRFVRMLMLTLVLGLASGEAGTGGRSGSGTHGAP